MTHLRFKLSQPVDWSIAWMVIAARQSRCRMRSHVPQEINFFFSQRENKRESNRKKSLFFFKEQNRYRNIFLLWFGFRVENGLERAWYLIGRLWEPWRRFRSLRQARLHHNSPPPPLPLRENDLDHRNGTRYVDKTFFGKVETGPISDSNRHQGCRLPV